MGKSSRYLRRLFRAGRESPRRDEGRGGVWVLGRGVPRGVPQERRRQRWGVDGGGEGCPRRDGGRGGVWVVGQGAQPGLAIHCASSMGHPGRVKGWGLRAGDSGTSNMNPAVQGPCTRGSRNINRSS